MHLFSPRGTRINGGQESLFWSKMNKGKKPNMKSNEVDTWLSSQNQLLKVVMIIIWQSCVNVQRTANNKSLVLIRSYN